MSEYPKGSVSSAANSRGANTRQRYTANSRPEGTETMPPSSAESGPNFLTVIGSHTSTYSRDWYQRAFFRILEPLWLYYNITLNQLNNNAARQVLWIDSRSRFVHRYNWHSLWKADSLKWPYASLQAAILFQRGVFALATISTSWRFEKASR